MTIQEAFEVLIKRGFVDEAQIVDASSNDIPKTQALFNGSKWSEAIITISDAYMNGTIIIKE